MRDLLTDEKSAHLLTKESAEDRERSGGALTRREWLGAHVMLFGIGVCNLFAVNLARTPGSWWFWMPAVAWAAALLLNTAWVAWDVKKPLQRSDAVSPGGSAR